MNAIFYLLRTGCPWRYLPGGIFPPRSTVYNLFRAFQREGVWERIWEELRAALRERLGRERARAPASSTASRSSRPKKGMRERRADAVGYDAGKKLKGRKIHALVDTEGLPLRVVVHSAAIQDRDGGALVLDRIRQRFNWLELVWADGGYNARQVEHAVAAQPPLRVEIVKRPDGSSGFIVLPRRWVVERTFSWFGRNRHLAKDYENLADALAAFITLACIRIALRRLART